ncbi:MAG: MTH938/NDUFAF3 family protein [Solirubrobacterales bacterium]
MASLEQYSFGRVVVDGAEHRRDLIVLPSRVVPNWWRRDGHSLAIEDFDEVIDELPERLVLGCGADSQLKPDPAVLDALRERGIEVEALPTADAVGRYTELDPARTAGAFHLTC